MKEKVYFYEVGMRRKKQDLYIRGMVSFVVNDDGDRIKVLSTQPPWIFVEVDSEEDVDRVVMRWWGLFVDRLRKFTSSSTIVKPVTIREVSKDEHSQ